MIKSAIEELTGYKEIHVNDRDDIILDDKWKISGSAARLLRTVIPRNNSVEHPCIVWVLWKLSERCFVGTGRVTCSADEKYESYYTMLHRRCNNFFSKFKNFTLFRNKV